MSAATQSLVSSFIYILEFVVNLKHKIKQSINRLCCNNHVMIIRNKLSKG